MPPLDVFLLIGQSNMAGRGTLGQVEPIAHPDILMYREGTWQQAVEPLHLDTERAGAGLAMSFALHLVEQCPGRRVGLIPAAQGGTPLWRWEPGADLYQRALEWTRPALEAGHLRGLLWHQGENDALEMELAQTYFARFTGMIAALRADLGHVQAPLVVGELGHFLGDDARFGHPQVVNQALSHAAQILPCCGLVSAEGLGHCGDQVHFSAAAFRELGHRYARVFMELERR